MKENMTHSHYTNFERTEKLISFCKNISKHIYKLYTNPAGLTYCMEIDKNARNTSKNNLSYVKVNISHISFPVSEILVIQI